MRGRAARSSFSRLSLGRLAALVAVALLTLAGVRATVMQAGETLGAMPMCVAGAAHDTRSDPTPGKAHAACEFCAAAAHAPVSADAPTLSAPVAVAWFATPPVFALGPRGPPAFRARARAPPLLPTA